MKITRPPCPETSASGAKPVAVGDSGGKEFAAKLDSLNASGPVERAGSPGDLGATAPTAPVADIGTDLKAGKIAPETAIDRVVERVLDRQLGPQASLALRAQLGAALRDSLADDPLLASKMRALLED